MSPHQVDFCYLQSVVGKSIESNPSSQKTWKPHWFYASGAWEFAEGWSRGDLGYKGALKCQVGWSVNLLRAPMNTWSVGCYLIGLVVLAVELDRAELSAVEQEQVTVVLALPSTERAADRLLADEGLVSFVAMRPSWNDLAMQARLMKIAKGSSGGSAACRPHHLARGLMGR
ncbi:unnamed protein product [Prunus armeniaca]